MPENFTSGKLWKAKNEIACLPSDRKGRKILVQKDELVEFRYQHNAHFRIDDGGKDLYLYLDESEFINNFEYVGDIFQQVVWHNRNSMKQIIECKLWTETKKEKNA